MTQEEKELLLKDLCARLPYGVKVRTNRGPEIIEGLAPFCHNQVKIALNLDWSLSISDYTPYLCPMSSITEEEMDKIEEILGDKCIFDFMGNGDVSLHQGNFTQNILSKLYDFYNSIHVDYRGLIPMGLALEAPEGMYK